MLKKFLCFVIILFFIFSLANFSYATDLLMDLDDNTIYSDNQTSIDNTENLQNSVDSYNEFTTSTSVVSNYEEDTNELSIFTITNIILSSIGLVLVLLGIAIIIKLN